MGLLHKKTERKLAFPQISKQRLEMVRNTSSKRWFRGCLEGAETEFQTLFWVAGNFVDKIAALVGKGNI